MSRDPDMEDAVSGIGSALDAIATELNTLGHRSLDICQMLSRIAKAQEIIAADVLEQQTARRARVREQYRLLQSHSEIAELEGRESNQLAMGMVLAANPWLRDEVQS